MDYARSARRRATRCACAAISTVTPSYPQTTIELPNFATDSRGRHRRAARRTASRSRSRRAAYEEAGIGPDDLDCAEVYDLSTAMELDWYEQIGLCAPGEAEKLLRDGDTTIGGRIPVNPSGGLACFGEAVPAQAIAQVCELTWQLRGQAGGRQVEGATRRPHGQPGPVRPRLRGRSSPANPLTASHDRSGVASRHRVSACEVEVAVSGWSELS